MDNSLFVKFRLEAGSIRTNSESHVCHARASSLGNSSAAGLVMYALYQFWFIRSSITNSFSSFDLQSELLSPSGRGSPQ